MGYVLAGYLGFQAWVGPACSAVSVGCVEGRWLSGFSPMVPLASGDLAVAGFKLGGLGEPVAGGDTQAVQDRWLCVGDVAPFARAQAAAGVVHQTQVIHQAEQHTLLWSVGFIARKVQQGFER